MSSTVLIGAEPFLSLLVRTVEAAQRDDEPVCVACLGAQRLHGDGRGDEGADASDEQLGAIAAGLARSIRGGDVVARLDGGRFGLLLHHCELDILDIVARRLAAQVPQPLGGRLGIAYFSDAPRGDARAAAEAALRTAREALAEAMGGAGPDVVVKQR
jgi:GGDEF domain-containing protein